jgi:hypothetical protein
MSDFLSLNCYSTDSSADNVGAPYMVVSDKILLDWSADLPDFLSQILLTCFPVDYPHWHITGGLKRYYIMQFSYWLQQLVVLLLGLEKPRKDYKELVAHHIVTLWLIGFATSFLVNLPRTKKTTAGVTL